MIGSSRWQTPPFPCLIQRGWQMKVFHNVLADRRGLCLPHSAAPNSTAPAQAASNSAAPLPTSTPPPTTPSGLPPVPPIRYHRHGRGHGSLGHGADQRRSFSISRGPLRTQTSFRIGISTVQQLLTECRNKLFIAYQSIFAVQMGGQVFEKLEIISLFTNEVIPTSPCCGFSTER